MDHKQKCLIRRWRLSDAQNLEKMLSNPKVLNNLRDGLPYPYTKQDAEFYINMMLEADPTKTFAFAITIDDEVIGSIGAFRQENIHSQTAEMGYYIGEPFWGRGFGTEAVKQLCDYVFETTDIMRIFAEPFSYNKGSCRILEKNGFQFEGLLRNNAVKNGKVQDMKMYSLVRTYYTDLETKRLTLKNISDADADYLLHHFSDEDVNRYLYDAEPLANLDEAQEIIDFYTKVTPKLQHRWILHLKENGVSVGTCGFHCLNEEDGTVEIGYDLNPELFRQGYMSEAFQEILDFARNKMRVKTIKAHIYPDNIASVKTAEKMGFRYLGENVNYEFRGVNYLHHVYALELV